VNTINFETSAEIANIKVRVEGSKVENTQKPAIDLTMTGNVSADVLPALLGCSPAEARDFWHHNGIPDAPHMERYPNIRLIHSSAVFENCAVKFGNARFQAAKMSAVSFKFEGEMVLDLHFKITLAGLSNESSGLLCSLFHDSINFHIESAQDDLLDQIEEGAGDGI